MITKTGGLTLLELIITLAIMAILTTLAYPLYDRQIRHSRRADAYIALHQIALAQEQHYTRQNAYANDLATLDLTPNLRAGQSASGYYVLTITNNDNEQTYHATATATGLQSHDHDCQTLSLNQLGVKSAQDADAETNTHCW
jgi:type IV pilus assembly protein PilE